MAKKELLSSSSSDIKIFLDREKTMTYHEKMSIMRKKSVPDVEVIDHRPFGLSTTLRDEIGAGSLPLSAVKEDETFLTLQPLTQESRVRAGTATSLIANASVTDSTMDLLSAAAKGDADAVRQVVSHKPYGSSGHDQAMQRAVQYGQTQVLQELLHVGADPDIRVRGGRTLLHEACVGGHTEPLKLLLIHVTDMDATDDLGQTACHAAAYHGELGCLKTLEEAGAECSLRDKKGRSPCHYAAQHNHPAILNFLLSKAMDIEGADDSGRRPQHVAAMHGALECLVLFLQSDCDTTVEDGSGWMAAHHAAAKNHLDCLRFLVKHGSDMEAKDNQGRTLAHLAAAHGAMTCLHWLLEKGSHVNVQDRLGNTPAHLAAAGGHHLCFNCCLQHGGSLDTLNDKQETPIDTARRFGHPVKMDQAMNNEVRCVHCNDNYELAVWEEKHQPNVVQKAINTSKTTIFSSPVPNKHKKDVKKNPTPKRDPVAPGRGKLPPRDLAVRYFGRDAQT